MAFCPNCGAAVEGKFCGKCGMAMSATGVNPGATSYASGGQVGQTSAGGITDNVAGALCYVLGLITGVLFLVLAPYNQNKSVRFHAFQSILFHVAFIGVWIVEAVVGMLMPWSVSFILSLLGFVLFLGCLALWVLLIVKAYQGQRFKLPVIGDIAEKQA